MSAFRELAKQRPANDEDGYSKLLCTEPGCGQRWSVRIDRPLCSRHAWGRPNGTTFVDMSQYVSPTSPGMKAKEWARRIVRAHESGAIVRPASLKMAQEALASEMRRAA